MNEHINETTHMDREGNSFLIRPITPSDKDYLKIGLKEMTPESRRQRFQSGKNDFSEKELKYLTEVDMHDHIAFVACIKKEPHDLPAGVIRGIKDKNQPLKLEIAITIIDHYQGRGLGLAMMNKLESYAKNHGYTHFFGDLHNSNDKMVKLLQKFSKNHQDFVLTHVGEGFLYFEVRLK